MNSRGPLISHRITGDTLAISDRVAITPTVQPAAAGTQRSRELDWLRRRDAVRVTDGEDIRFSYGMPMFSDAARWSCRPRGLPEAPSCARSDGDVTEWGVVTGRLACATVSGNARDSK